jgi:hypothetical protein
MNSEPNLTTSELNALLTLSIEKSEVEGLRFDERIAIQLESRESEMGWTGKTTTERAVDVLDHPDRFPRYMVDVARAWVRSDRNVRIFRRVAV